jgi:hypothetical protein
LEHIFSVGGTTRNPLGGPKNSAVMCLEQSFQLAGGLFFH